VERLKTYRSKISEDEISPENERLMKTVIALCVGFPKDVVISVASTLASTALIGAPAAEREQVSEIMRDMCLFEPPLDDG
jgi:hypothetical protein